MRSLILPAPTWGEMTFPEDGIQAKDILDLKVQEMKDGKVLEDGISSTTPLPTNNMKEAFRTLVFSKKKGDAFQYNIYELEDFSNRDVDEAGIRKFVNKYYLNIQGDAEEREFDPEFMITIENLRRMQPAEMDETFFKKMFGPETDITTEAAARDLIKENIESHYDDRAKSILMDQILQHIVEVTDIDLPEAFLKRYILVNYEKADPQKVEAEFDKYVYMVKASLVQSKLSDQYEIEVSDEEVAQRVIKMVQQYSFYFQIQSQNQMIELVKNIMQNPQEYQRFHNEIVEAKLREVLFEKVPHQEKAISADDFEETFTAFQDLLDSRQYSFESASEEEE